MRRKKEKIEEKIFQSLEELKELNVKLEDMEKKVLKSFSELAEKIDKLIIAEKTEKKEAKTYLLIDGPNILSILVESKSKLDWKALIREIKQIFGETEPILWSFGLSSRLLGEILNVGIEVRVCAWKYGKDRTDEKLLEYIENQVPSNSLILLLTKDRDLKRKAADICLKKRIKIEFLTIDLYKQQIMDSTEKIAIPFQSLVKEEVVWEEVFERFKTGNLDPQKFEEDRVLVEILKCTYYILPDSPERQDSLKIPRGFNHLVSDIASHLHAAEYEKAWKISFTRKDIILILKKCVELGLVRRMKIKDKIFYIRTKEWPAHIEKFLKS